MLSLFVVLQFVCIFRDTVSVSNSLNILPVNSYNLTLLLTFLNPTTGGLTNGYQKTTLGKRNETLNPFTTTKVLSVASSRQSTDTSFTTATSVSKISTHVSDKTTTSSVVDGSSLLPTASRQPTFDTGLTTSKIVSKISTIAGFGTTNNSIESISANTTFSSLWRNNTFSSRTTNAIVASAIAGVVALNTTILPTNQPQIFPNRTAVHTNDGGTTTVVTIVPVITNVAGTTTITNIPLVNNSQVLSNASTQQITGNNSTTVTSFPLTTTKSVTTSFYKSTQQPKTSTTTPSNTITNSSTTKMSIRYLFSTTNINGSAQYIKSTPTLMSQFNGNGLPKWLWFLIGFGTIVGICALTVLCYCCCNCESTPKSEPFT